MSDFFKIDTRPGKRGVTEIYPKFIVGKPNDLMIRGSDFYAIWIFDEAREFRGCIIQNIAAKNYGIPFYLVNLGNAAPDVIERRKIDERVDTLEIY